MAEESVLRERLRKEWRGPGELAWVEAASGGTVGIADVFVPLDLRHGYMPVELKWWKVAKSFEGNDYVSMTARPAQIRFHRLAAEAKQRTAFLVLLSNDRIALLPGNKFPGDGLHGNDTIGHKQNASKKRDILRNKRLLRKRIDEMIKAGEWLDYFPSKEIDLGTWLKETLLYEGFWKG